MPELPEAENVSISLKPHIFNHKIISCKMIDNRVIKQEPKSNFQNRIKDSIVKDIYRRGKYIILLLETKGVLYYWTIHLKMTGVIRILNDVDELDENNKKHLNFICKLDNGKLMTYSDVRKFGDLKILNEEEFKKQKSIQDMGPEIFWENGYSLFLSNIRKNKYKNKPIKNILLKQEVIAGIGNIYANEALWYSKINPYKLIQDLSDKELNMIFEELKTLIKFSISVGGSSIKDYMNANGEKGQFQNYFQVYKKEKCSVCKNKIIYEKIDGRATFYCPNCQH